MNLPNKLTLSRVIMVPFFVAAILLSPYEPILKWVAIIIFITASITDLFDGKIARKYNLVTNFGKFADPLADKLLVCSALICMTSLGGAVPAVITIIIIAREFIISGFRLIAAEKGTVIAASMWGKFKTTFQMIMVIGKMLVLDAYIRPETRADHSYLPFPPAFNAVLFYITETAMYIALILTVISLCDYLFKNKDVLKDV